MSGNSFDYKYYNSSILNQGEKARLARKTHKVGEIFLKHISNDVPGMSVDVLNTKDFGKEYNYAFGRPNSIHARFRNDHDRDKDKVLIYSWPRYNEFDESKWNNFLSQLKERDYDLKFIGTGPLEFKYKGFNYSVYPPAFSFSQKTLSASVSNEVHTLLEAKISSDYKDYEPFAFSFSQEEANKIIENIKRSHQSIKKKIIDHYQSLGKDFVKNDSDFITIGTDINNKTRLSSVIYFNGRNGIDEVKLELYKATPLHLFAKYNLSQQLEDRLDKGTDVNAMDESEKTPLHYAAEMGHVKIVQILLGKGANVNAKDEDEKTPLDLAKTEEIKALLLKAIEKTVDESSTNSEGVQEEEEEEDEEEDDDDDVVVVVAPTEPAQTEEQPSSFFGSLFSILMKPFSLIGSFFGGFFSWLLGSDEPSTESEQPTVLDYQKGVHDSDDII
ncbi:ankyrin repeat domain-containing protein [Wolbachia endosymbiont of Cylisticus convexus]|uniref:ankyrin repeat domain-containing protein n=1 Tax=Wolbachia endosymbiont of Cylisticus convexus TaxID=118728 RepID=UPI000DF6A51E|nr:ankyrin repeat domain-containing protein [Wolbachia endosymbiont of Cylisticus convexus]RDD35703.1 ankyrin repeat domain-containing protein [Wolbachia endosymbiont of Cylisticus convexus]